MACPLLSRGIFDGWWKRCAKEDTTRPPGNIIGPWGRVLLPAFAPCLEESCQAQDGQKTLY